MRFWFVIIVFLCIPFSPSLGREEAGSVVGEHRHSPLFTIKKSSGSYHKTVVYEARLTPVGFDLARPIKAYWKAQKVDGLSRTLGESELNAGYKINVVSINDNAVSFVLASVPDRNINVTRFAKGGDWSTVTWTYIDGVRSKLDEVLLETIPGSKTGSQFKTTLLGRSMKHGTAKRETLKKRP